MRNSHFTLVIIAGSEAINCITCHWNPSSHETLKGQYNKVEQTRIDVHNRTIPVEHILTCLPRRLLVSFNSAFDCRLDQIARYQAQKQQIRNNWVSDRCKPDNMSQLLVMVEVISEAFQGDKLAKIKKIKIRPHPQAIVKTMGRLQKRK